MKKLITSLMVLVLTATVMFAAPKPKIMVQNVTPYMLSTITVLKPDSCITTGLSSVANQTFVYLSVMNVGDTSSVQSSVWTFNTKPSGSTATLTSIPSLGWYKFFADVKGVYKVNVSITTSTGTKDSLLQITSSDYVGVGGFDGVPAVYPNCMSCHGSMPEFTAIFDRWKVGAHGTTFKTNITSGSTAFGTSCFKCHTTGYDKNKYALNNGFDDKARTLGWVWSNYSPPKPGNWDTIKNRFSSLVAYAGIGCEMCHGAGSEHTLGGDTTKIDVNFGSNACASCHDNPWRYPIVAQWKNSAHGIGDIFEGRNVADSLRNNIASDCNRCHDGRNQIDYTKKTVGGPNVFTKPALVKGDMTTIGCPTCHDPHGNSNDFALRNHPSDTLANGYSYAFTGAGKTCMTCHQSRRNNKTYVTIKGAFTSTWGTHGSPQGDVLMGQNFATFGFPFISGSHKNIDGACVGCHMAPTTDTGTVTRDKVGGHTWNLHYAATNYDHTTGCNGCHPGKTSFDDFMAPDDFDGNGLVEAWQKEVAGCLKNLRIALPPAGVDSVAWGLIARDSMNLNLRKAFWNYQMITNDKSMGMHNPALAVQVLLTSKLYAVGVQQNGTEVPAKFELSQNYPNPFNPTTKISFSLPKAEQVTLKIYDITGKEILTLVNQKFTAGTYSKQWSGIDGSGKLVSSGVYFYKIIAGNNIQTKRMVLIK